MKIERENLARFIEQQEAENPRFERVNLICSIDVLRAKVEDLKYELGNSMRTQAFLEKYLTVLDQKIRESGNG